MPRAAAVQFRHRAGDKPYNLDRIEHFCAAAEPLGVELIVFPEMCVTGYWHVRIWSDRRSSGCPEAVPEGRSTMRLVDVARRHRMIVGAGLIERDEVGRLFNTFVVATPAGGVHRHRKLHCFISPHMDSGDTYTVFQVDAGYRIGVLICYDNNLIENARATALAGADILLAPHQTGGCASRSPHGMHAIDLALWEGRHEDAESLRSAFAGPDGRGWLMRWLPARANDNGLFLVFANGVGRDDDELRTGNAMILDCYGRTLAESRSIEDDMVVADLDLDLLDRCTGRRWIRARRPELYGSLVARRGDELPPRQARFSDDPT